MRPRRAYRSGDAGLGLMRTVVVLSREALDAEAEPGLVETELVFGPYDVEAEVSAWHHTPAYY